MEALIEAGKVSAVIVKDLSRFGREHVETSRYLEIIYPTLGVKFVAIQERVDNETGEGTEMMPFHNIFNEWYAAQTSKKVRAVWAMKAANGKRSNFRVPYGYKRDELDKEKWLVDDAAAEVVQRIYHLCLEGKGPEQIARLLQKEKVLTPTAYYYSVGSSSANRPMPSDPYLWKDSTIDAILSNRKYRIAVLIVLLFKFVCGEREIPASCENFQLTYCFVSVGIFKFVADRMKPVILIEPFIGKSADVLARFAFTFAEPAKDGNVVCNLKETAMRGSH